MAEVCGPSGRGGGEVVVGDGWFGAEGDERSHDVEAAVPGCLVERGCSVLCVDVPAQLDKSTDHVEWLGEFARDTNKIWCVLASSDCFRRGHRLAGKTASDDLLDRSNAGACASMETLAVHPSFNQKSVNLRLLLAHMIDETAHHSGHIDLIRDALQRPPVR